MSKAMILKPRMSEKAYGLSQATNTYVFEVPRGANKQTVAEAVKAQFEVSVTNVRIANKKGKAKRTFMKRSRPVEGRRNKPR
ncbi:MAG: 50S ribosomal protein L23 [Candidatus Saccharibacteria bacterium]|nr:50S ribosomal protein L23 [Candidatus Saccharibacteria bacterium]